MKRVPRALAPAARVLACAAVIALFALSASAQNQITLELNKLEDRDGSCRAYLVFGNSGERFDAFVLDLIVFDRDQLIAKHLAVNVAPLRAGKTIVKIFDIVGVSCARIGRVLLNDVSKCQDKDGDRGDCVDMVMISSRATSEMVK